MSSRGKIQLHCQTWKHGLIDHLFIGITLISMCGEYRCINYARKVFDEMLKPNVVTCNAVILWNVMLARYVKMLLREGTRLNEGSCVAVNDP